MKAKHFNYVVHSAGRTVKGNYNGKTIDVDRMTQVASWIAQKAACKEGWKFDLMNFIVAIQSIHEN